MSARHYPVHQITWISILIELIILVILIALIVLAIRSGKSAALENPLIIERAGQYHATLAPQLNLAQALIEAIAKQFGAPGDASQNSATQCFEVRDQQATAHGHDFYLLAITLRNGMLYFQAIAPRPLVRDRDSHSNTLMEFASAVLVHLPAASKHDAALDARVVAAAQEVARRRSINIKQIV